MKRIILTWASSGLGASLAEVFHDAGYEVIGLCRTRPADFINWIETDFLDDNSLESAIKEIKSSYSNFDVLVLSAGIMQLDPIGEINKWRAEDLLKINVLTPWYIVSELINLIKTNEADIVNVWSTVWFKAYESQAFYGASKWAVRWLDEYLRLELKKSKVRVIGFNPGWFKSEIVKRATWKQIDLSPYMEPSELAKLLFQLIQLPKNMEVSEIIINRK